MSSQFTSCMCGLLAAIGGFVAEPALAHHSYAMFDRAREVQSVAVVREWQFTNPHATLWVYIDDAQGKPVLWGLEAPGPSDLLRAGWDRETVKPGDKVTVTVNPLRDGRNGGSLVRIVLANGRALATGGPPKTPVGASPGAALPAGPAGPAAASSGASR